MVAKLVNNKFYYIYIMLIICNVGFSQERVQNDSLMKIVEYRIKDSTIYPILDSVIKMANSCLCNYNQNDIYLWLQIGSDKVFSIKNIYYYSNDKNIKGVFYFKSYLFVIASSYDDIQNDTIPTFLEREDKYLNLLFNYNNSYHYLQTFDFLISSINNNWYFDSILPCAGGIQNICNKKHCFKSKKINNYIKKNAY